MTKWGSFYAPLDSSNDKVRKFLYYQLTNPNDTWGICRHFKWWPLSQMLSLGGSWDPRKKRVTMACVTHSVGANYRPSQKSSYSKTQSKWGLTVDTYFCPRSRKGKVRWWKHKNSTWQRISYKITNLDHPFSFHPKPAIYRNLLKIVTAVIGNC